MKEYLLLRKNVQSGPFKFNDLVAMQLQPTDLVWVEGTSFNWRYPEELEELSPYVENGVRETMVVTLPTVTEATIETDSLGRHKAVIAIKPSDNKLSIKTIKSTPNLLKVEVREETADDITVKESYLSKKAAPPEVLYNQISAPVYRSSDNRIEFFVLAVGAVSLLAVLYLLITTSY